MRLRLQFLILSGVLLAADVHPVDIKRLGVSVAGGNFPCSAALTDGRSFLTGGGGNLPLTTAQFFGINGSTVAAAPMVEARAAHICVALRDNTVLVAGGIGAANRPTNSTEIFHTGTGQWTPAGSLLAARTGAAAILLADGRVLVAGGEVDGQPANTLEIYDAARGRFDAVAGVLSAPRKGHSLAVLEDGRVLIAGGTVPGGFVVESTDIFDSASNRVLPGPRMAAARTSFSATRLADGKVLVAGGSDGATELDSAELFDPETGSFAPTGSLRMARQGHLAIVIPGNGRVLIAGGNLAGKSLEEAELFIPWRGAFEAAVPGNSGSARGGAVISVGRLNNKGRLVSTTAYTSPTIAFVKTVGEPREAVAIRGSGWQAGEEVKLRMGEVEQLVTADGNGQISSGQIPAARKGSRSGAYMVARGAAAEAGSDGPK